MLALACPTVATSCALVAADAAPNSAEIASPNLPGGLTAATLQCGETARAVTVWTLEVDASADYLGVRDAPLFNTNDTGPLQKIAAAALPGEVEINVFVRAGAGALVKAANRAAPSLRRYATFCDAEPSDARATPLDCSVKGAHVKARATAHDADQDGALDVVHHEVSIYPGADRLHVVSYAEPYRASPLSGAALWIDVLSSFDLLTP